MSQPAIGGKKLSESTVSIVGLGLMGGSLGLALKPYVSELHAVDSNLETIRLAEKMGLTDRGATDLARGVSSADLIILGTPVNSTLEIIRKLPTYRPDGCIVLDLGSTKRQICQEMSRLPASFAAMGGHPMCGREKSGLPAASADLYQGQTFLLCRTDRTTRTAESLILELVQAIGAEPLFLTPERHDSLVSTTSHLPYILSSLLMDQVGHQAEVDPLAWRVSATGLKDATRLAGSNPEMMLDILLSNHDEVIHQIDGFQHELQALKDKLMVGQKEILLEWLEDIQRLHKEYLGKGGQGKNNQC
jgi:prephenate dehydrogenase